MVDFLYTLVALCIIVSLLIGLYMFTPDEPPRRVRGSLEVLSDVKAIMEGYHNATRECYEPAKPTKPPQVPAPPPPPVPYRRLAYDKFGRSIQAEKPLKDRVVSSEYDI